MDKAFFQENAGYTQFENNCDISGCSINLVGIRGKCKKWSPGRLRVNFDTIQRTSHLQPSLK